jgi:hypothetical protein
MGGFTCTQAQAKEEAPPASRKGGLDGATVTKTLSASPPLTTDRVDKIHVITAAQLVECSRWLWSN